MQLRTALAGAAELPVSVSSVRCLWACKRSCAVAVRSPSRVGYVLADLEPTELTAQALLEYATRYAQSEDGAVPYREWPAPLKGHFVCRFPSPLLAAPAAVTAALPASEPSPAAPQPHHPDEPACSKNEQLP